MENTAAIALEGTRVLIEEERSNYPISVSVDDFGMALV